MGRLKDAISQDDDVAILDAMIAIIVEKLENPDLQGRDAASLTKRLKEMRDERAKALARRKPDSPLAQARKKRGSA